MKRSSEFLERVFALMGEKRLTYRQACRELGRRGASAKAANKRRTLWRRTLRYFVKKVTP